jgi:phage baseplate assembly protein W
MAIGANSIITFSNGSSDQQTNAGLIAKEKIKFILTTQKGEIPNDPEYGADLNHFCFMPVDDVVKMLIETTCRAEIARYLSYVTIQKLAFRSTQQGVLDFTLYYELMPGWEDNVDIVVNGAA